jgi:hypothetical protein
VGQRPKKDQGQIFVVDIFNGVFELPSPRNAQKRTRFVLRQTKPVGGWVWDLENLSIKK